MAYRSVAASGKAQFVVRDSEFLGYTDRVPTVGAAEQFIETRRRAHPEATHVVPAYRIRGSPVQSWASDDGEPSGAAGSPALTVLEREALENVVAVVVRYYGGTNLGVGGLARAYARGVKAAVADAGITDREPHDKFRVTVTYDDSGTVRDVLESVGATFEASYEATVVFEVRVPTTAAVALRDQLQSATSGRATIERAGD